MDSAATVPGLVYVPGWVDPDACRRLIELIDAAEWSSPLSRRVQHYGHRYDYGRRGVDRVTDTPGGADGPGAGGEAERSGVPPLPVWATELAARLLTEERMDRAADQVIVNEYEPGQGISAHVDSVPSFGPVVAALSLGSPCVMEFTRLKDRVKAAVRLAPGSLCVMAGDARYAWSHSIAARKSDPDPSGLGRRARGRRISVTFRTVRRPATGR